MSTPDRAELRAIWQKLARRYDWSLVEDEAAFLDLADAERTALGESASPGDRDRIAVWRAYSTLLYRGLWRREERAAQELWLMCARMAIKDGRSHTEADELAQEVVARALEKLPVLRSPQSTISWVMTIVHTVLRERGKHVPDEQPPQVDEDDESAREPADPVNLALEVEGRLIRQELLDQLRMKLPNDLERLTMLRIVVFGDHPRDVARDLGIPLYRTRVAKSRALKRLREDESFIALLRELAGDPHLQPARTGADDHDT